MHNACIANRPGPRLGAGSPGLGPRLQGPYPAHVSALLAIYVCIFYVNIFLYTLIYVNLYYEYANLLGITLNYILNALNYVK